MFEDDDLTLIEGTVDTVIYQNPENFYAIVGVDTKEGEKEILVGTLPTIAEGDRIAASGRFVVNPKYGKQFQVVSFEKKLPTERDDILSYLSTGAIKGIGPKLAAKIVSRFGEDTFDIIENHPDWLAEIPGISEKNAKAISQRFVEAAGVRQLLMFCKDFLTPAEALTVYRKWGSTAVEHLTFNPYSLCEANFGFPFQTADRLGIRNGIRPDAECRVKAGILYVLLEKATKNGHTVYPENELITACGELLGDVVSEKALMSALDALETQKRISPIRISNRLFWALSEYRDCERDIAKKLKILDERCPALQVGDANRLIFEAEARLKITYAEKQREAIMAALTEGVTILTGGPGTGKTTVIQGLVFIFESLGLTLSLAAPTGRAAKKMSEATGREARTIHRLLDIEVTGEETEPRFFHNEKNPLDSRLVIIDEASMLDVLLTDALLKALRPGTRLILIGDEHQLPSVGAGNLLSDLIASGRFTTIFLREIFRQKENSGIVWNAHEVVEGRHPDLSLRRDDFFFLKRETPEQIAQTVVDLINKRLPDVYGEQVASQIQVITPSRKGEPGTYRLNMLLQDALNPGASGKAEKILRTRSFREGDRVMQVRNNYSLVWESEDSDGVGIFNGDIGTIESVDHDLERLIIRFDDRTVAYDFAYLDELELAYAITVHKSQGSEYPIVVIPVYDCPPMLQTRNLIYTALTRASRMVILVGRTDVFFHMIDNDRQVRRFTALPNYLRENF